MTRSRASRGGRATARKYRAALDARAEYLGEKPKMRYSKKVRDRINRRFLKEYKKNTGNTFTKIRKTRKEVENLTRYFPRLAKDVMYRAVAEIQVWTETDIENIIADQGEHRREFLESYYGNIFMPEDIQDEINKIFELDMDGDEALAKCEQYGDEQYQSVADYDDTKDASLERLIDQIADLENLTASKLVYWILEVHYMEKVK